MATKLQLFNTALGRLGVHKVASVDEDSNEAEACRTFYDSQRRSLLRDYNFNFAITEVDLSEVDGANLFDYDYAYQLPSDYIKAIKFDIYDAGTKHDMWKIAGQLLHTDITAENATLEYIFDETDCTKWDDVFFQSFSYYLAAAIAPKLSKSQDDVIRLLQIGQSFFKDAKANDHQESKIEIKRGLQHSEWQKARRGFYEANSNWMIYPAGPPN